MRPCAGRRRGARSQGFSCAGGSQAPGPPGHGSSPRWRRQQQAPSGPFLAARWKLCEGLLGADSLPDSTPLTFIDTLLSLLAPQPCVGLHRAYSFLGCEKVRCVTWSSRQFLLDVKRKPMDAGVRIWVAPVRCARSVVGTAPGAFPDLDTWAVFLFLTSRVRTQKAR